MSSALKTNRGEAAVLRKPLDLPTRNKAVSSAIANTVIEGLCVSMAAQELLRSWAQGNLTDEELLSFSAGNYPERASAHGR